MKIIHESDVISDMEIAIATANEEGHKIALIELNIVETLDFLDQVYGLTNRGFVIKNNGIYFYKQIELKLNLN